MLESSSSSLTEPRVSTGLPGTDPTPNPLLALQSGYLLRHEELLHGDCEQRYGWYQATAGQPPFPASSESETSSTMQQRKAMRAAAETSIA